MTKKRIILILAMFVLVVIPISATEIPHQAPTPEQVLATAATVAPKPTVVKPVVKKKVVAKKKAPAKKKERLITAPPLITVETAPHSGR